MPEQLVRQPIEASFRERSPGLLGSLRRRWFGISPDEITVARRGFRAEGEIRVHVERVGESFSAGYHAALQEPRAPERVLEEVAPRLRGFAYEGAAMGLALLDFLSPWKARRLQSFLDGPGERHVYMMHVGAGWAIAKVPIRSAARLAALDPLLRWLAVDGMGFFAGYFHWPQSLVAGRVPSRIRGYARRAFDQGLGRSLWFVEGADVSRVGERIDHLPEPRRADLWSGVGLAATYTGWVEETVLSALRERSAEFHPQLAQGAAFAAKARQRALNPLSETELACRVLCGMSVAQAAAVTDDALVGLPGDGAEPAYEIWRRRIQQSFVTRGSRS